MPLGELRRHRPRAARSIATGRPFASTSATTLLGRVLDGLGRPIDGGGPLERRDVALARRRPPARPARAPADHATALDLGVRALDALVPCGRGQRLGIFAGSGVGKSTLLGMIARATDGRRQRDRLVGERGREVREFIERDLGPEGWRARSWSSRPPTSRALVRIKRRVRGDRDRRVLPRPGRTTCC